VRHPEPDSISATLCKNVNRPLVGFLTGRAAKRVIFLGFRNGFYAARSAMAHDPLPPHSFAFEYGKIRVTASGAGLVALILIAAGAGILLARYFGIH
jgi:hypothetical protein